MTDYIQVPVGLLSELAESLACELDARYPDTTLSYEWMARKYQAEMEPVLTARQIIADAPDHFAGVSNMAAPAVQGEPVTGGLISELLAAIQFFGSRKREEGSGLSDPTLHGVRSAWDEVYRLVQAIAAPQPAEQKPAPNEQMVVVVFDEDAALSIAERTFSTEVDEQLASDIIQYAQRLHSLYTAPKPVEQKPAPDVSALVDALEQVIIAAPSGGPLWHGSEQIVEARKVLADYRKQGGEL